jgi:hypothetical protein
MRDGLSMMAEVAPWALPIMLSWVPPRSVLFVTGALLCEHQVS